MPQVHETMIETDRLLLRPMAASDIDPLLTIFADPVVMAAFDTQPFDREQMAQWVQRNLDHQHQHGYGLFSVLLKSNNLLIGDCGLEQLEVPDGQAAELGYDFRSDYWTQGYATEAATAVHEYAFQQLQLPRLISLIRQSNLASQRVAEKIGMRRVEELVRYGTPYWLYERTCESLRRNSSS
jgi:RimJ/RimL family protein N-acetyltransferase